jgi:hypothetical protein
LRCDLEWMETEGIEPLPRPDRVPLEFEEQVWEEV